MLSDPLFFFLIILALLPSLSFHEAAHAFAANILGDPTAKHAGRLTLNPIAHLDLFGTLAILLVHFGWGKPVPVNPRFFSHPRRDNAIVAFAGPAANFILAFLVTGILSFFGEHITEILLEFLDILLWLNLFLGVFNLIPLPPFDGASVLIGILPKQIAFKVEDFIRINGSILFFVLLGIDLFFHIPIIITPISFIAQYIGIFFSFFWTGILSFF